MLCSLGPSPVVSERVTAELSPDGASCAFRIYYYLLRFWLISDPLVFAPRASGTIMFNRQYVHEPRWVAP